MAFWNRKKKVSGKIAYYGLTEWWLGAFTERERDIIRIHCGPLDEGDISYSSHSVLAFLGFMAPGFAKAELYEIAKKILEEGERHYSFSGDVLDRHFFCLSAIQVYYANRDNDPVALERAIYYCKEQISLAPKAKKRFLTDPVWGTLPRHVGYTQLSIIYEKQKRYEDALAISEEALAEGWNIEDSSKRIDRLKRKIQKQAK